MTVQEAKEILNNIWDFTDAQDEEKGDIVDDAITMSIEALEKQIPKKVKSPIRRGAYSDCPICGIEVEMPWCYCYKCGQRLDWGE